MDWYYYCNDCDNVILIEDIMWDEKEEMAYCPLCEGVDVGYFEGNLYE